MILRKKATTVPREPARAVKRATGMAWHRRDGHHLVSNIVGHMADGVERQVQESALALWRRVDLDLGARPAQGLGLAPRGAHVEADAL